MNNEDQIRPVEEPQESGKHRKRTNRKQTKRPITNLKQVNKGGNPSWKKGKSGNSKGRPKKNPLIEALRGQLKDPITQARFMETCTKYFNMPYDALSLIGKAKNKNPCAWDSAIIAIMMNMIKKGDERKMAFFMDHLIGVPKKVIEISNPEQEESKVISPKRTKEALLVLDKVIVDHKN